MIRVSNTNLRVLVSLLLQTSDIPVKVLHHPGRLVQKLDSPQRLLHSLPYSSRILDEAQKGLWLFALR